jgi:hypothetical protein
VNVARALAPLDALRARVYRAAAPLAAPLAADRGTRVTLTALASIAAALVLALAVPLTALVWAPVVLGVPHLVADLRYLVVRPGLHRRASSALGIGLPLTAVSVVPDSRIGLLAILGAILAARAPLRRRAAALAAFAPIYTIAAAFPFATDVALAHVHNFVAVALWLMWRAPEDGKGALHKGLPVFVAFAAWALLAVGALGPLVATTGGPLSEGALARTAAIAWALAPFGGKASFHLVVAYVFAQGVHYGVWLRMVPEDDRPRPTPRPFAASYRALVADFGPVLLAVFALASVVILAWGALDAIAARAGYLRGALFHGHLELAALALALLERRRPGAPAAGRTGEAPCIRN